MTPTRGSGTDEMLMGVWSPCVLCQSLPYASETALHALVRQQAGENGRLVQNNLDLELRLHAVSEDNRCKDERIDELEEIVRKLNDKRLARRAS